MTEKVYTGGCFAKGILQRLGMDAIDAFRTIHNYIGTENYKAN